VAWTVEVTEEFEAWWDELNDDERVSIDGMIRVLETHGPALRSPYSSEVTNSRYEALRQLHVPHLNRAICVLYVSDEQRAIVVLLTGTLAHAGDYVCPPEQVAAAEVIYGTYLARRSNAH
jgi:hypothetical protein